MASWLGHAQTNFYAANKTIGIPLKTSDSTPLLDICKSVTPPCKLSPLLPGGNAQTMYTVFSKADVPIHYKRKVFQSDDPTYPGSYCVDFVDHIGDRPNEGKDAGSAPSIGDVSNRGRADPEGGFLPQRTQKFTAEEWSNFEKGSQDTRPMLVTLHGLSGGSHELYLREVLAPLVLEKQLGGGQRWEICVVNARGCAGSVITSSVLFNARATWDCRQTVKWLRQKYPNRPLFGLGFSLGGNILVNYLGEEGDRCELLAAVVVSNPWDLHAGSLALQRTWVGKEVYSKAMGANMKKLFEKHVDVIKTNPRVDIEKVRATTYLHEFDRELQGPTWGYPTEGAYYRDASSTELMLAARVPLFAIHATDDPVAADEALPYQEIQQNPFAVLCTTSMGGHLGWFESGGGRWFVKPAVNFLRKMAEDVDASNLKALRKMEHMSSSNGKSKLPTFDPVRRKLHWQQI